MKKIGRGIYIETGYRRVNVAAIETGEGFILIDTPPYPEDAQHWRDQLAELSDRPVQFVINTDHHRDRILGNGWFDAPVVSHRAAADQILTLGQAFVPGAAEELATNDEELVELGNLRLVPPQVSYQDTMQLVKDDRTITLTHRSGATSGSTWIEFPEERVIFVGDHIVTNTHPFMQDAVSKDWLDSLNWLRRDYFSNYKVVPGRGSLAKPASSRKVSDYVGAARRRVRGLFRSGRPRSDTAGLVEGLLAAFPVSKGERPAIERRIRAGLEHIYDEFKSGETE